MAKFAAKGVVVKSGSSATPTQVLPGVDTVTIDTGSREMIDVTSHDSSNAKEYIKAPLKDTLSADIDIFFDPGNTYHDELVDAHAAGTKWYLTFVLPDTGAAEWAAGGYITNMTVPALDPQTGALKSTISFKADGAATYTQ